MMYLRLLVKKFIFQVHPDYFCSHKQMQETNSKNLSYLQMLVDQLLQHPSSSSSSSPHRDSSIDRKDQARHLIFFVKPTSFDGQPKKVKVATRNIEGSLVAILETIGVDLPRPDSGRGDAPKLLPTGTLMLASPEQVLEYLQSIPDRKELMLWREERAAALRVVEQKLLDLTGARSVQYRNSWSSQNNLVMISRLISLINQRQAVEEEQDIQSRRLLHGGGVVMEEGRSVSTAASRASSESITSSACMGLGLDIVFTCDEVGRPVDYSEGAVYLNPTDVPVQWSQVLGSIRREEVQLGVDELNGRIHALTRRLQSGLALLLNAHLRRLAEGSSPVAATAAAAANVTVVVRRGFTCRRDRLLQFLSQQMIIDDDDDDPSPASSQSGDEASGRHGNRRDSPRVVLSRPIEVCVVVEDAHGSMLLTNGSLRIDVRSSFADVMKLMEDNAADIIHKIAKHHELLCEIDALVLDIRRQLSVRAISQGIGVDEAQFAHCLRTISYYANNDRETKHALKQLSGVRVIVGHYLGMTDDGSCVLPWDLELPSRHD